MLLFGSYLGNLLLSLLLFLDISFSSLCFITRIGFCMHPLLRFDIAFLRIVLQLTNVCFSQSVGSGCVVLFGLL